MTDNIAEQGSAGKLAWWHLHKRLYNWVVHWADTKYGVLALIILAITEPIFVPIPADVLVLGLNSLDLCLKASVRYFEPWGWRLLKLAIFRSH